MKKIILISLLIVASTVITAQDFYYKSNLVYGVSIHDAVELNGKFYLVGSIDSSGTEKPYFCTLNNQGVMVFDTILNASGRFVNIHKVNNALYISYYSNPFNPVHQDLNLQMDTNFVLQGVELIADGIVQKSKLINDSIILYIGYDIPPAANTLYSTFVVKQNIITGKLTYNIISNTIKPPEAYDIISPTKGTYHLYLNSPDSSNSDQVIVYYLNDSLQVYRSMQLNSSYQNFGSDSSLMGPLSVEYNSGGIYMNCIANHPTYLNQLNDKDLALVKYDTNYNEKWISFSGRSDTNYITSRNAISINNNSIYTAGTGSSEILLTQHDTNGNRLKLSFYNDNSLLKLKKILAFNNSLLIVGNTNNQFFALKLDSLPKQIKTGLNKTNSLHNSSIRIFPNPATDYIKIDDTNIKIKQLTIYNQHGSLVKTINSKYSQRINIEDLKSGVYFIKITTKESKVYSIIFIKS